MSQVPPSDDERTVANKSPDSRGQGQFVSSSSFLGHTLPEGTRIGGLEITGLIGEGGFGIVYLAFDPNLQRQVAVKEYMPSSLAARGSGSLDVIVKSQRHIDTFKAGLKSFVNEARLLARFDHPSLVKVYRFWEANGTAYMAMPYYEGPTLKRALADMGEPPDEDTLRGWLRPLLDALTVMHNAHCYHRDIAPDNILLTPTGPLLLDFGAARRVIGDMTHALTVVLKPGYAPIEQYGEVSTMSQGAWTDLYALACVVYHAITGKTPMTSVERLLAEGLEPLSRVGAGRYSPEFLGAMDAALAVKPQDRPQDVAQFRALLDAGRAPPPPPPPYPAPLVDLELPQTRQSTLPPTRAAPTQATAWSTQPEALPAPAVHPAQATKTSSRRRAYVLGAGACVAAAAMVAALWNLQGMRLPFQPEPAAAPADVPAPAPAPAAAVPAPVVPAPVPAPIVATPQELPTVDDIEAPAAPERGKASPATPAPQPTAEPLPEPAAPVAQTPARKPAPAKPLAEATETKRPTRVATPEPTPRKLGVPSSRCSDILQKASLEPLTPEEAAYLRRECR